MAKSKKEQESTNLFDNPNFTQFQIEEDGNLDSKEKDSFETSVTNSNEPAVFDSESKTVALSSQVTLSPEIKKNTIESFISLSQPLVEKALKLVLIKNDDENVYARDLAKELSNMKKKVEDEKKSLNKPLKDEMEANNDKAKIITEPLDNQVARLKTLITNFETDKEKKRQEELLKLKKEKEEREEKERLDRERVSKIRNEIQRLRELSAKSVNDASTMEAITKVESNLLGWTPKKEFFMEFFDEVNTTFKNEVLQNITNRKIVIKELEEQKKKNAELALKNKDAAEREQKLIDEKIEQDKIQKEQEALLQKAKNDAEEISAKNEITMLVASLGVKDFEVYTKGIIEKYGNCREAVKNRDKIIKSYQDEQEQKRVLANIESKRMKNQRVDYIFTIEDETQVPREFLCVDESKIKKAILENRPSLEKDINSFKINGILITTKTQTVLKK